MGAEKSTPYGNLRMFTAGGAITKGAIVKFGADEHTVVVATTTTEQLLGVAEHDAASGEAVRVLMSNGETQVKAGGTITLGALVTSGAAGVGVAAAPAQGVNAFYVGRAMKAAASGDLFPVHVFPGVMQGA